MKQVIIGFGLLITALLILFRVTSLYHAISNNPFYIFSMMVGSLGITVSLVSSVLLMRRAKS